MPIAIMGDKDSGKSTFLVLTYATQVRYTADSQGDFRFYVDPVDLKVISKEYNNMKMGKWPTDKLKSSKLEFSFGYGMKKGIFSKFLRSKKSYSNIKLRLFDISKPEYKKMRTSDNVSSADLSREMDAIRSSRVWIILADPTNKDTDKGLAGFISNITLFAREDVYPLIVITKYDRIKKKRPVPKIKDRDRKDYEKKALKKYFPKTLKTLRKIEKLNNARVFFSSVTTEKNKGGEKVPSLEMGPGGYNLVYSYPEYVGMIDHIGKVGELAGWDEK